MARSGAVSLRGTSPGFPPALRASSGLLHYLNDVVSELVDPAAGRGINVVPPRVMLEAGMTKGWVKAGMTTPLGVTCGKISVLSPETLSNISKAATSKACPSGSSWRLRSINVLSCWPK